MQHNVQYKKFSVSFTNVIDTYVKTVKSIQFEIIKDYNA